jgi:hypothetical protein
MAVSCSCKLVAAIVSLAITVVIVGFAMYGVVHEWPPGILRTLSTIGMLTAVVFLGQWFLLDDKDLGESSERQPLPIATTPSYSSVSPVQ